MIPAWALRLPINLIYDKAEAHKLDPYLIMAMCWVESRGMVYAVRYEKNYKWLYKPEVFSKKNNISFDTEVSLQKHSFGLMQIMGATARWLGFGGALPALYKPENNLYWATKYLAKLSEKYHERDDVIAAYNAGSARKTDGRYDNQDYVDKVVLKYNELKRV